MPNWVYNSLEITHPDVDKVNALEKHIKDQFDAGNDEPDFFDFLLPNPDGKDAGNWYDWNIENWGCKWDASDLNDFQRDGNILSFTFTTAWSNPVHLFQFLAEEKWEFRNVYTEEADQFFGVHTHKNDDNCVELPRGRRNMRRFKDNLEADNQEVYEEFAGYIDDMIERLDEDAEDNGSDYENEDDEEDLNDNLPITEASRIIAEETPKLIKGYEGYCKHSLATAWKIYLKQNAEMYDEKWFAIIGTEKIYETLNWKWICEELNKLEIDPDEYENDDLALELNYGNCLQEGKHEKTNDEDWNLFCETIKEDGYSREMFIKLKTRLAERNQGNTIRKK